MVWCQIVFATISLMLLKQGCHCAPTAYIPPDMWEPELIPGDLPLLSAKQAIQAAIMDKHGLPYVMQDLSQPNGHLDMDDETNTSPLNQPEYDYDTERFSEHVIHDDADHMSKLDNSQLLYGQTSYGTKYVVPIAAQPVVQAKALVPVVFPVMHQALVPVAPYGTASQTRSSLVSSVGVNQISAGTQGVQTAQAIQPQQQSVSSGLSQIPSQNAIQSPQVSAQLPQSVPTLQQPQQQPSLDLGQTGLPRSGLPQGDLTGQGRLGIPQSTGLGVQQLQPGVARGSQQSQQVQQSSDAIITVKHETKPQKIHIILPKVQLKKKKGRVHY